MRPLFADLRAVKGDKNVDRFYKIDVAQDLFQSWSVSLYYGRRGTQGHRRNLVFASQKDATAYAEKILKSKLRISKSRGCAYYPV